MKSAIAVFFLLLLFLSSLITIFILRVVNYEAGIEIATSNERSVELGATAYYKPLPKQKKFVTGSYRREIRLNGSGTTATGKPVRIGHAAADPRVFPFDSILEVPGHGRVIIEDVGSRIKGERLDIFVGVGDVGRENAMNWGKKTLLVTVLDRAESRNGE